jgi:hypothetical protein
VSWHKSKNRWQVQIQVDKQAMLGYFSSEIDAARAYNEAARAYFGEFAKLNDLEEIQSTKNTDDLSK